MSDDLGPPGKERPSGYQAARPVQKSATTTDKPIICHAGVAQWFRRRRASQRLVALDCGCADPWKCRCRRPDPPLTDHQVDGWRATAQHLLDGGTVPMVPAEVLRRMHRRGGADRRLAQQLWELVG